MSVLRKLAGQTAIYGASSIAARFLNYLLTPLYTSRGVFAPAQYGVITYLYSWTAFLNVVLTYGMETTFFRFAARDGDQARRTYSTAVNALTITSLLFMLLGGLFAGQLAAAIGFPGYTTSVRMLVFVLGIDALTVIPMARMRQEGKALKFATINFVNVAVNISLNLFFLAYCMPMHDAGHTNALIDAVYDPSFGVGYVFLSNLAASAVKLLLLLPEWPPFRTGIDRKLLRPMLAFGLPLLAVGLAGMVNETADRVLMKHLLSPILGSTATDAQIGIYGACYKLAILITLFTQAFRYAAEPFFFSHAGEKDDRRTFARIMNVFVAVCMGAFLLVMLFLDLFKHFIPNPAFWPGLVVVPILMLANVFLGIYYNQSVWYKLSDRTRSGGAIALIGAGITIVLLFWWIPIWGYLGAAWATLCCYAVMAAISYVWGQRHYPIPYNVSRILGYMAFGVAAWWGCEQLPLEGVPKYAVRAAVFIGYLALVWRKEGAKKAMI